MTVGNRRSIREQYIVGYNILCSALCWPCISTLLHQLDQFFQLFHLIDVGCESPLFILVVCSAICSRFGCRCFAPFSQCFFLQVSSEGFVGAVLQWRISCLQRLMSLKDFFGQISSPLNKIFTLLSRTWGCGSYHENDSFL